MKIEIPPDVRAYVKYLFKNCNDSLASDLTLFPGIHEESLDMNFVSTFARSQFPYKTESEWTVRIDAHFIGGGRHFGTWEVADIGLMMIFRHRGKVIKSKIALLQSKKLYADSLKHVPEDPYIRRFGLGRLLVTEEEHQDIVKKRALSFSKTSKYQAFKKDNVQQETMESFQKRFDMEMFYLFYNPLDIPFKITMPLDGLPELPENKVGCRVVSKEHLDFALKNKAAKHVPSYGEVEFLLSDPFLDEEHYAGWRLEHFVGDLMLDCKKGMIDNSPNFSTMVRLMEQKSRPMSAAVSLTFDMP